MATTITFLTYTNDVLRRLNEVQLDSTQFASATSTQGLAKDAVNNSIREIIQSAQEWPFNITTFTQTLTAGTGTYSFQSNFSSIDYDSFYLKKHATKLNDPKKLPIISYPEYLDRFRVVDENATESSGRDTPAIVYQTQEEKFGVTPIPDADYQIEYKYFILATEMSSDTDTTLIPDRFKNIIVDGAMMYMMRFRSNNESSVIHQQAFQEGIKMMRRLLTDDKMYVRSSYIERPTYNSFLTPRI